MHKTNMINDIIFTTLDKCKDIKINNDWVNALMDVTINPVFLACTWKILEIIRKRNIDDGKLFWMDGGNMVGYTKYNSHLPWDDDIDIGLEYTKKNDIILLLNKCKNIGFDVFIDLLDETKDCNLPWHEKQIFKKYLFDREENLDVYNNITESQFVQIIMDPEKILMLKIVMNEQLYLETASKLGFEDVYKWEGDYISLPWIDIFLYKNVIIDGKRYLIIDQSEFKNINIPIENNLIDLDNFIINERVRVPVGIKKVVHNHYGIGKTYSEFLNEDRIFSHIKNKESIFKYDNNDDLYTLVKIYIDEYNKKLKSLICDMHDSLFINLSTENSCNIF